jgi:hypothetical protein
MSNQSLSNIYLSAFLATGATGGGWALTDKLAGHQAAMSFLYLSASVIVGMLFIQGLLFLKSKKQARFLILLNIASVFGLLWMMTCLVLPIFWMASVGIVTKLLFLIISMIICWLNVLKGIRTFSARWTCVGEKLLSRFYKRDRQVIDWCGLVGSLKLTVSIHIPGLSERASPAVSVVLVISMLAGLSLRNISPVFSVFAWGLPSVIVIATFLQMIGFAIGQFLILTRLEKKDGNVIRPL